ncbi:MAG: right-handed parallel beta-helix repeat-containing protein, partial [Anaerolineae bacterium]
LASLPNGGDGVAIFDGAHHNTVGGTTAAERNVIAYNGGSGVLISGNGTTGNTVSGNWIGFGLGSVRQAYPVDQAVSPAYTTDCTMFVASLTTGVHKTTDCGATWLERNSGLSEARLLQIEIPPDATNASVAYVLAENGYLFSTSNSGASWSLSSTVLEQIDRQNLVLSTGFSADQTMYAAARNWSWDTLGGGPGIFKSTDAGVTWTRQVTGMSDPHVWKVIASPDAALKSTLLALTNSGIEKTTDAGVTWSSIPSPDSSLIDLAFSPAYAIDQTFFASANSGRIYRSTNGGVSWTGFDALRWDPRFLAVSPDYSNDHEVYHGGGWNDTVYRSTDSGATWTQASTGLPGWLHDAGSGIVFSPAFASDGTLWVVSVSGMARSTNRGATWEVMRSLHSPGNTQGIVIRDGAEQNTIGPDNVIGNNGNGVVLESNVGYNVITGNLVGTDTTGTAAQANVQDGLSISGHHNTIGGSNGGNLVSGNLIDGIRLAGDQATANIVAGNTIGTTLDGAAALGNRGAGVSIHSGAFLNLVGGMTADERNLISGNGYGVGLWDTTTMSNTVSGNYIGTNRTGTAALGNGRGIDIHGGAHHNAIGGTTAGERNLISGNNERGVSIDNNDTMSNTVSGNYIGVDATGLQALPNRQEGVTIGDQASYNRIGGPTPAERNVISANGIDCPWCDGIFLSDDAHHNTVEGNYIGTDASGTAALGNSSQGVDLYNRASDNLIRGNLIAGNRENGVTIWNSARRNLVEGNLIGTDASGSQPLPNGTSSEKVDDSANLVATLASRGLSCSPPERYPPNLVAPGTEPAEPRTVSPFCTRVSSNASQALAVEANDQKQESAVQPSDQKELRSNGDGGIYIAWDASDNTVGPNNTIAFNAGHGVQVQGNDAVRNRITHNSIFHNDGAGIALTDGGNSSLAAPRVTAVNLAAGTASGAACANCTVEVFSDDDEEGRTYEGSTTASAGGQWAFNAGHALIGPKVAATATDAAGNTSAFSPPFNLLVFDLHVPNTLQALDRLGIAYT